MSNIYFFLIRGVSTHFHRLNFPNQFQLRWKHVKNNRKYHAPQKTFQSVETAQKSQLYLSRFKTEPLNQNFIIPQDIQLRNIPIDQPLVRRAGCALGAPDIEGQWHPPGASAWSGPPVRRMMTWKKQMLVTNRREKLNICVKGDGAESTRTMCDKKWSVVRRTPNLNTRSRYVIETCNKLAE